MKRSIFFSIAVLLTALAFVACGVSQGAPRAGVTAAYEPAVSEIITPEPAVPGAMETPTRTALSPIPTSMPTTVPAASPTAAPTMALSGASGETVSGTCPEPTEDTYLLRNPLAGYCLLYPDSYAALRGGGDTWDPLSFKILKGSIMSTDRYAFIDVVDAAGRTVEQLAQESVAQGEEFGVNLFEIEVAGQPALIRTGIGGQDLSRNVLFVHDGMFYSLRFGPDEVAGSEISERLTEFADVILNSFTFIPVSETITVADECLQPGPDEQLVISEALGVCFLLPPDYVYEELGENSASFQVGPVVDADHPKLLIEVTDAGDKPAWQVTEELSRSLHDPEDGPVILRIFSLGNATIFSTMVDGVSGQDLGRMLLFDHDDRRYRLTFVPFDPAQPELTGAMEALVLQVTQSFRFLPQGQ